MLLTAQALRGMEIPPLECLERRSCPLIWSTLQGRGGDNKIDVPRTAEMLDMVILSQVRHVDSCEQFGVT